MFNGLIFSYIINFWVDDYIRQLFDLWWVINYNVYKICCNFLISCLYYIIGIIGPTIIKYTNYKFIYKIWDFFLSCFEYIESFYLIYNRWIFKYNKRRKIFYRFNFLEPFRLLFYIYFLILLTYIWKRRTMYRKTYLVYYYLVFYFFALFLALFIDSLIGYPWWSAFIGLTISWIIIILCLK